MIGKSHHFFGSDPRSWHTEVPQYARVKYEEIYNGIDLVFYDQQQELEYDFVVAPGADPEAIRLGFEGAQSLLIDAEGDLVLLLEGDEVRLARGVTLTSARRGPTARRWASWRLTFWMTQLDAILCSNWPRPARHGMAMRPSGGHVV